MEISGVCCGGSIDVRVRINPNDTGIGVFAAKKIMIRNTLEVVALFSGGV